MLVAEAGYRAVAHDRRGHSVHTQEANGLFCFIGASPASDFLTGIVLDEDGFIKTDRYLVVGALEPSWELLGRDRLPFETSIPGVFAVGDVRHGSVKRVAAAVGEGSAVVGVLYSLIHPENRAPLSRESEP